MHINNDGVLSTAHCGNTVVNELQKDKPIFSQLIKPLKSSVQKNNFSEMHSATKNYIVIHFLQGK